MTQRRRVGIVWTWVLTRGCLAACLGTLVGVAASARADQPPAISRAQVVLALTRLGCEPESLAAAGLAPSELAPLVEGVRSALAQDPARLRRADADVATKRRLLDLARQGSESDPTRSAQIAQCEADVAQSIAQRDAAFAFLRAAAFAGTSTEVSARHARVVRNRAWKLPTRFLVKDRSDEDWVSLRDALARASTDPQADLAPALRSLIDDADRDPEVLAAALRLRPDALAAMDAAWNAAIAALP